MRVITLDMQLEWTRKCLKVMQDGNRPENEIALQKSIVFTLEARIQEKLHQA